MRPCSLLSLATAVPPHIIEQADAKAFEHQRRFDHRYTLTVTALLVPEIVSMLTG